MGEANHNLKRICTVRDCHGDADYTVRSKIPTQGHDMTPQTTAIFYAQLLFCKKHAEIEAKEGLLITDEGKEQIRKMMWLHGKAPLDFDGAVREVIHYKNEDYRNFVKMNAERRARQQKMKGKLDS